MNSLILHCFLSVLSRVRVSNQVDVEVASDVVSDGTFYYEGNCDNDDDDDDDLAVDECVYDVDDYAYVCDCYVSFELLVVC